MLDCLKHDCVPALKNLEAHMTWHIFASSVIGIEMNKKLQILDSLKQNQGGRLMDRLKNRDHQTNNNRKHHISDRPKSDLRTCLGGYALR